MKIRRVMSGIITTALVAGSVVIPGSVVFADSAVKVDEKNFPDKNFREYVGTLDTNGDGSLSESEINAAYMIQCDDMDIESLSGIEFFTDTQFISCRGNLLTSIDISKNENLQYLLCEGNRLTSLDISNNPLLTVMRCSYNQIDKLDLSANSKLVQIDCSYNKITALDVSNCLDLEELFCSCTHIKSLDVSNNKSLVNLDCEVCELTELDLSSNAKLKKLLCKSNKITKLDISNCVDLIEVDASFNALTSVDVSKCVALKLLNVSQNQLKTIDITTMPDLEELNVAYNQITELDTTKNEVLRVIYCYDNQIKELDLSKNLGLTNLGASRNPISKFDISKQEHLEYFSCGDCNVTSLDLSNNPNLFYLSCENNELTSLDLSNNPKFWFLEASNNKLTELDVSNKPELAILSIHGNNIEAIDLSNTFFAIPGWGVISGDFGLITSKLIYTEWDGFYTVADDYDSVAKYLNYDEITYTNAMNRIYMGDTYAPYYKSILAVDNDTKVTGTDFDITQFRPADNPEESEDNKPSVEDFAERLYTTCLGRESELEGKAYWAATLRNGTTGAEVAEGFFFSPEYEKRALSNEDYIKTLYETFMGRTPADDEVAYWASEMKSGKSRMDVFDGFVNSPEWANICLGYGIKSGGTASPTYEKDASAEVIAFAERLYTTCLGREAEEAGLNYWAQELANLRQTGTVAARGFFFSAEFLDLNLNDEEYVTRLYRTFMGREPEETGFKYWVGELKSGMTRQDVFDGFSRAQEFMMLCSEAGIMR